MNTSPHASSSSSTAGRRTGRVALGLGLCASALVLVTPAQASTPAVGWSVDTFHTGSPSFRAADLLFEPSGDLLVADRGPLDGTTADGSVVSIDPGGSATTVTTGLADPTGLARGPGSATWGSDLYVADHNFLTLGSSYGEVFRFTGSSLVPLPYEHDFPLLSDPLRIDFGDGGGFGTDMYVVDPSSGPGSSGGGTGYVRRISSAASQVSLAGGAPFVSPVDVAFGPGGDFGDDLYVADYEAEKVFTVDSSGTITPFADLTAYTLAFSTGGPLGTTLFVHEADQISAVDSDGVVTPIVTGVTPAVTGIAVDPSGTCVYYTDGNSIDRACLDAPGDVTAPGITITTPVDGGSYTLGQSVLADYECEDEVGGSGLDTCLGTVPEGAAIDTAVVGSKTFTVDAVDLAGNPSSASVTYDVTYAFGGFRPPVDPRPAFNAMKAGAAVPVKFGLGGDHGLDILAVGFPKSEQIPCVSGALVDGIESTVSAGSSSLTYDAGSDQYAYVWKTQKAWSGTCRQLVVKLDDGTTHRADFLFR